MLTKIDVQNYIQSKSNSWAPSTLRSEQARLRSCLDLINKGPEALYEVGSKLYGAYTLKTLFIRAGEVYSFCYPAAVNPFKAFMLANTRLFKYVYNKEILEVSYEEACSRIADIKSTAIRELANFMLHTGLRADEVIRYKDDGLITGKGGKPRKVLTLQGLQYPRNHGISYSQLHKALAEVNLKPHTLRKLYASKLAAAGLKGADLMSLMGWSSIQTASLYIQPKEEASLRQQLESIFK